MLTANMFYKSMGENPLVNSGKGLTTSSSSGKRSLDEVKVETTREEYLVTLNIPDFKREDIVLESDQHVLLFSAGHQVPIPACLKFDGQTTPSRWEKIITLPEDADTLFITAHYINGQLKIHVPRSKEPGYDKERLTVYVY